MSLARYEKLYFNANFEEAATRGGFTAYRGELILKEGEIADAQGRRKPPTEVLKQAVLLADGAGLKLVSGSMDELQQFPLLLDTCGPDLKADTLAILFVVNIPSPFVTALGPATAMCIPLVQGMVWNELADLAALEKGDFKGLSAADKVVTLFEALKDYKAKSPTLALEEALKTTNNAKRENHGAV